jgi:hypothetical protein
MAGAARCRPTRGVILCAGSVILTRGHTGETGFPTIPATSTLTVQSKDDKAKKTCTLQFALDGHTVSGSIPAGTYDLTLMHSKTANVQLAGSGFSAAVTAAGGRDLETSVDLSSGTYTTTCKPTTVGFTPGTKKLMVKAS